MNNNRRKKLLNIYEKLSNLLAELDCIIDDENEAFNNMPQSIQNTDKGELMQNGIDSLEIAKEKIETALSELEELME